jgi:hypothetical protein
VVLNSALDLQMRKIVKVVTALFVVDCTYNIRGITDIHRKQQHIPKWWLTTNEWRSHQSTSDIIITIYEPTTNSAVLQI